MTTEGTLRRCQCGDPMFVKRAVKRSDSYLACHHCERQCLTGADKGCPRCITMNKWFPDVEGPGYNDYKRGKGGPG